MKKTVEYSDDNIATVTLENEGDTLTFEVDMEDPACVTLMEVALDAAKLSKRKKLSSSQQERHNMNAVKMNKAIEQIVEDSLDDIRAFYKLHGERWNITAYTELVMSILIPEDMQELPKESKPASRVSKRGATSATTEA